MNIKCIAKRMSGGQGHEHISHLWWINTKTNQEGSCTRAEMVSFIEKKGDRSVWCPDKDPNKNGAWVHVHNNGHIKYVQTVADNRKTDNLLWLPNR